MSKSAGPMGVWDSRLGTREAVNKRNGSGEAANKGNGKTARADGLKTAPDGGGEAQTPKTAPKKRDGPRRPQDGQGVGGERR